MSGGSDTPWGDQVNVEGNHLGSWNFAINYYLKDWKFRAYLEHFFDDHSQMFWQYGRWKDGQIGIEITLPKNRLGKFYIMGRNVYKRSDRTNFI